METIAGAYENSYEFLIDSFNVYYLIIKEESDELIKKQRDLIDIKLKTPRKRENSSFCVV